MYYSKLFLRLFASAALVASVSSCEVEDGKDGVPGAQGPAGEIPVLETMFSNKSTGIVKKPLVAMSGQFSFVEAYSLISTADPAIGDNNFRLAGSADGAGFLKDGDGYMYVVNCEDSYAVARIKLDENLNPISGDYLLNSGVADVSRQCSATMWEKEIHGGDKDLFLSASEAFNFDVKGIDPRVETPTPTADFGLDALGEFGWENAVPLPKDAYPGKTVIIGGDDDNGEATAQGQVVMYLSENNDADLEGGDVYVLRFKEISGGENPDFNPDLDDNDEGIDDTERLTVSVESGKIYDESNLDFQHEYAVEFVKIDNAKNKTFVEMGTACNEIFASRFMRVEDVDYQKGSDENGRNVFFAVTGRGPGRGTYNDWGTAYKLVLDANNPLEGKLTQIVSGNTDSNNMDGNMPELQSPDNITVTENFVYLQEDPNSFSRGHAARIYQTDLNGNNPNTVLELIVRQDLDPNKSTGLSGEFGALIDISDKVGVPDTFLLALQPHYWESDDFKNLDGHDRSSDQVCDPRSNRFCSREDDQASQIVILRGLPR